MTGRRWSLPRRCLAAAAAVSVVVVACGACSGSGRPADDRARVRSSVQGFGQALVGLGSLSSVPGVSIGDCAGGHWAAVQWSAPLRVKRGSDRFETEHDVLGQADTAIRLGQQRILDHGRQSEPALVSQNRDRTTVLTVTVPNGQYVRVDGYASC